MNARLPDHEDERLAVLATYEILDTVPEAAFDELVELASDMCAAPIAAVSMIDRERQWFKAAHGFAVHAAPRSSSFCAHTILQDQLVIVPDTTLDPRFADLPSVRDGSIRFYAGAPLTTASGHNLGTLCVFDHVVRELTPRQARTLECLARQVMAQLELRLTARELERHQARLRAALERDRALEDRARFFDLSVDPMCIATTDGYFKRVNAAFVRTLGYPVDQLTSMPYLELVHEDDRARTALEAAALATGAGSVRFENRYRARDGSFRVIAWTCVSVVDEGLIYGIARDITETRLLQEQLIHAQKMEAVGRLAGGIAHDFNNVLSVIMSFATFAQDELPPDSPVRGDIEEVVKAAERAASLTRQLLVFSRKELAEAPRVLDLDELVGDVDKMLRRIIGADISLHAHRAAGLWPVRIDAGQLEQVLVNLIVNARDAMPGGGTLVVETANVTLEPADVHTLAGVAPGDYVMLAVGDTGTGIDAATQQRMFEPFFTTKADGKGTGLGLATVFAIVTQAGGHLRVHSEPGHGATFEVYLPRAAAVVRDPDVTHDQAAHARGSETILLVEDEPLVRAGARRALEKLGYAVLDAGSAEEALALLQARTAPIDLLVTDVIMPGMRGPQLAAAVSARQAGLKVLFMSGYTEKPLDASALGDGQLHFIAKPFTVHRLGRTVRAVLTGT